jgi:hypothetical protein
MLRRCSSCGAWIWEWVLSSTRSSVDPERTLESTNAGAVRSRSPAAGGPMRGGGDASRSRTAGGRAALTRLFKDTAAILDWTAWLLSGP